MLCLTSSRCFRICLLAAIGLLAAGVAIAGGNLEIRDPSIPSQVIQRKWDPRMIPITWVLSEEGIPGSTLDNPTLTTELSAAFDSWESIATSSLDWEFGGEVPLFATGGGGPLGPGIDGNNLITFTDTELLFPPGVLGLAISFSFSQDVTIDSSNSDLDGDGSADIPEGLYSAGTLFDSDIAFNSSAPWSNGGANGSADVQAVALHEIGHSIGLCHSMVRDAVMWPFLNTDVAAARSTELDDEAYASFFYSQEPAYSAAFGGISGTISSGFDGAPLLGAHVYATDPISGVTRVGAYSSDDGSYVIPGLAPGDYLVAIEPLDGDPVGLDPVRINDVVQFTFDTNFPEEFYDADEAAIEADPGAAITVSVAAATDTAGIDLVTNTTQVPGANIVLEPGYNLFAYPVQVPTGLGAFELLEAIGDDTELIAIDRYDREAGSYLRAEYVNGLPAGVNFPIVRGEGYVVYMSTQKVVGFTGNTDCPPLTLEAGLNLIGVTCPPAGYRAFEFLLDVGAEFEIESVQRYDTAAGQFETAIHDGSGMPSGVDFSVSRSRGYAVQMKLAKGGLQIPPPGSNYPPVITGITPGRGVPGEIVVILGEGFDPDIAGNTVTFNGIGAGISFATPTSLTTVVPPSAASGPVRVDVGGQSSNTVEFTVDPASIVEILDGPTPMISGQTVDGLLSADGEQDRFTFTALAGSLVSIDVTAVTPGVPDTVALLEDPFGIIVATDDNSGFGGVDARINNFELPETGTYTVVVSNAPGGGTGPYQMKLSIKTRATAPQVSVIGGNFQTGVPGTVLADPLSVYVTGPTGNGLSNATATIVASDTPDALSSPQNAGTTIVATNNSGLVQINTTLPNFPGVYLVSVTVDGVPSTATFAVSASNRQISSVELLNNFQSGTVDQELPEPLRVELRDLAGLPVPDALVAFRVVAGGGEIMGTSAIETCGSSICKKSDLNGRTEVTYKLGTKTDEPQIVAAFVPGLSVPLLFEASPRADTPTVIESLRSNFNRMTIGTSVLNAIELEVRDTHGNPVPGAAIAYSSPDGLVINPGLGANGEVFQNFRTNAFGRHVARVTAPVGAVTPTFDEFRAPTQGAELTIQANISGSSAQPVGFVLSVDMGPVLVTNSLQNDGGLYGQPLTNPVQKKAIRWQREDVNEDNTFINDDYMQLQQKGVPGVSIELEALREDRRDDAFGGRNPIALDAATVVTVGSGIGQVNVTDLGQIGGVKQIIGRTDAISVDFTFEDGSPMTTQIFDDPAERFAEATNIRAIPVTVTVDLSDNVSGIEFSTIELRLNETPFFDGSTQLATMPEYPEPLQVYVGATELTDIDLDLIQFSVFTAIQFVWQPTADRLLPMNMIKALKLTDKVGNEQDSDQESTPFTYP